MIIFTHWSSWKPFLARAVILLCLSWPVHVGAVETLYITDRVAAAMYPAPRAAGKPMDYLPTGTTLRVLTEQKDFVRIRTPDGREGWIQRHQLQEDAPAQVLLLSLVQQHERTTRELDRSRQQLVEQKLVMESSNRLSRSWWIFFPC